MLRIVALRDRTGRYYLGSPVRDLPAGTETARWAGTGGRLLGFGGPFDDDRFRALLEARRPDGGPPLTRHRVVVSGFDLTFAAPKSVSVLAALSPPELARSVVEAHRSAVDGALAYLERHAVAVRSGVGEDRELLPTSGAVAAAFVHATSRSFDPHLHSHVVVANLSHGTDGRWRALDGPSLYAHRRAAGQLYQAALRAELRRRHGVEWEHRRNGTWELAGMDPVLLGAFSGRAAEVRMDRFELARATGAAGGRRSDLTRRARRPDKVAIDRRQLEERWHRVAARSGGGRESVGAVVRDGRDDAPPAPALAAAVDEYRFAAGVHEVSDRTVVRRTAVAAWAGALSAGTAVADVESCVEQLAPWGSGHGTAEVRRAPAEVVAPAHLLRTLGPRPSDPTTLALWTTAARQITAYRDRWGVRDPAHSLGTAEGRVPSSMSSRRLAEHLQLTRRLDEVQRRLGRSSLRSLEEPALGRER